MTKLKLFLIIFPVDYLKEIIILKTNKLLKYSMVIGEFIRWLVCWFYMGSWVRIPNRKKRCSTADPKISVGVRLSDLIRILQGTGLK